MNANITSLRSKLSALTYDEMKFVAERIYANANALDEREIADALSTFASEEITSD